MSATDTGPAVRITLDMIYTLLTETKNAAEATSATVKEQTVDISDHEQRLRSLERSVVSILAVGSIMQVAVAAAIAAIVTQLIRL